MSSPIHKPFAIGASIAVVATVAWGFVLVGSPANRRLERLDDERLRDLQTIVGEIQALVADPEKKQKLRAPIPQTLEEAARRARGARINLQDPETGEPYVYTVANESTYEICAQFARPREKDTSVFWNHPAGRHCFSINALDPPPFW